MEQLSIVILTKNEEEALPDCLESVANLGTLVVVDDGSTDQTVSLARTFGATVYERTLDTFAEQRNFALSKITTEWVLFLDADERVSFELRDEIVSVLPTSTVSGYKLPRKNIIFGKWIEYTDWYPDYQLHLFRVKKGSYYRDVHEQVMIDGAVSPMQYPLVHENYQTIDQFLSKNVFRYAAMEADLLTQQGYRFVWTDLLIKPSGEFLRRFFLCKGYMDGVHGLVLSLLMAFHSFTVYVRLWERGGFENQESGETLLPRFVQTVTQISHDFRHWIYEALSSSSHSSLQKIALTIKRHIPFL